MEINITNLETKMCSNTFNEDSIKEQLSRQFSKFDNNGIVQVEFKDTKNSGIYEVFMKLEANKKTFSSAAKDSTASKAYAQAKSKLSAQVEKQRSVKKQKAHSPRGGRVASKILAKDTDNESKAL